MILISSGLFANGVRLPIGSGAVAWQQRTGLRHTLFGGQDPVDQWMPVCDIRWRITAIEIEDDLSGFSQVGAEPIPFEVKQNGNLTVEHKFMPSGRAKGWVCTMRPGITPTGFLGDPQTGGSTAEYEPVRIADWLREYGKGLGDRLDPDAAGDVEPYGEHHVPRFYTANPSGKLMVRDTDTTKVELVTDLKFPVMIGTYHENDVPVIGRREMAEALAERAVRKIGVGLPVRERSAIEASAKTDVYRLDGKLDTLRAAIHRHATALTGTPV